MVFSLRLGTSDSSDLGSTADDDPKLESTKNENADKNGSEGSSYRSWPPGKNI